ncbi:MAG: ATP synthase F0 subunit B [Planctomycetia bacterium]|nr:ATP synthase F0 subunit B [Planctomycetia bacterium]
MTPMLPPSRSPVHAASVPGDDHPVGRGSRFRSWSACAVRVLGIGIVGAVLGGVTMPCHALAAAPAKDAAHGDDHGHGTAHGHGHAPEIGHNPPHGVSQKDFESPAWFQTDLALWSFAVFLLLLFLLTKFAWNPILEGLEKRERGIAETIAATQQANHEAKRMLASYERRLAEAADEVRGMLDEARRDAEATRQSIVAEARRAADDEQARAKREIGIARDEALSAIAERAGQLAVGVAGKFLREKLSADEQARLVRDSVAAIQSTPSRN